MQCFGHFPWLGEGWQGIPGIREREGSHIESGSMILVAEAMKLCLSMISNTVGYAMGFNFFLPPSGRHLPHTDLLGVGDMCCRQLGRCVEGNCFLSSSLCCSCYFMTIRLCGLPDGFCDSWAGGMVCIAVLPLVSAGDGYWFILCFFPL